MQFGPVPLAHALGAVLAHSVKVGDRRIRKGRVLERSDLEALSGAGVVEVTVAKLASGDVAEDLAALRLAQALVPDPDAARLDLTKPFTGRVNLVARAPGIARIDAAAIEALNMVDPMITCATVAPMLRMDRGGLVATIKIISYGVDAVALNKAIAAARNAISLLPVKMAAASLVMTQTGAGPDNAKGVAATRGRLEALGMALETVTVVDHACGPLAEVIKAQTEDLILILTASATSDPQDVAPNAVRAAGGQITRFGMPVDPGNLLFLGEIGSRPVIGLPGCARAPALNGTDWILERIVCGLDVSSQDIARMGVGGLLKEIPQRPQPRRRVEHPS